MDVRKHSRHLSAGSEKFVDLPTQSSLLHRFRHMGFGWTKTPIWTWIGLLSLPIRHHHRRLFAIPLLAVATMAPQVQGQIHQHPNRLERCRLHSPSYRHQLLVMVCGWVHLPILDETEKLFVVVQVQLRHKCCAGLWHRVLLHLHLLHPPISKGRCFTKMVGQ